MKVILLNSFQISTLLLLAGAQAGFIRQIAPYEISPQFQSHPVIPHSQLFHRTHIAPYASSPIIHSVGPVAQISSLIPSSHHDFHHQHYDYPLTVVKSPIAYQARPSPLFGSYAAAPHPTIIKAYAPAAPVLKVSPVYSYTPYAHFIKSVPVYKHSTILRYSSIHQPHIVKANPFIKSGYASAYAW